MTDAIWVALGNYHARDHVNGLNVGTYLPVALPIWLFGKSEIALSLWPLVCSLLGRRVPRGASRSSLAGASACSPALLYATYPGDVFFSTVVMPDAFRPAGSASPCCWLSCHSPGRSISVAGNSGGAGVALGICHLIRANDVILVSVGVGAVAICPGCGNARPRRNVARLPRPSLGLGAGHRGRGLAYLWAADDFFFVSASSPATTEPWAQSHSGD